MPATTERSCPVCGTASTLACAACRQVHYCSRPHQKQHWKLHKLSCRPWTVRHTEKLGRFMVATRTIKPGEVIFREPPLVVGPKLATGPVCLGCHRPLQFDLDLGQLAAPAVRCSGCGWSLCRSDCDRWHSEAECRLWSRVSRQPDLRPAASGAAPAYGCVAPVRCLLLRQDPEAWSSLTSLEHHLDQRRHTALYRMHAAQLAGYLTTALPADCDVTDELVLTVCGLLDTNAFEVRSAGGKLRAVYASASLQNHDCRPNTRHVFDDDYVITVRATVPIAPDDVISTSYTQPLWSIAARQQHLQFSKCFVCRCARCRDPTELGTMLGSLTCGACSGALLSTQPDEVTAEWRCDRCGRREPAQTVSARRAELAKTVQTAERTVSGLEAALKALDPLCGQRAELSYALVQLYGAARGYSWEELSAEQLLRKQQLCRELLQLADISPIFPPELSAEQLLRKQQLCRELLQLADSLTPGLTRFRGVLLLELCRTQRHLLTSKRSSESKQWQEATSLLQEASTILQHETGWPEDLAREKKLLESLSQPFNSKEQSDRKQPKKENDR